jgi:hypothetical protein
MALRDKSWILSGATPIDSHSVLLEYGKDTDHTYLTDGTHLKRTRNIITREWVALTQTAAQGVKDCKSVTSNADANTKYTCRLDNRICNAWVVTKSVDSMSAWGAA